jgi:preprotein translocase subunit SecF
VSPTEQIDESTTLADERPIQDPGHGVLKRLYHGETRADIVGRWKLWFALSGVVILIGVVGLVARGLNLGIDFTGGTVWELQAGDAEVTEVTDAMAELGYNDVQVQEITQSSGGSDERFLRVEAESTADPAAETTEALDAVRADIRRARADAPAASQATLDVVRDALAGVEGPFREAVPQPLTALQAEVDDLAKTLGEAEDDAAKALLYESSTERMLASVDELEAMETAERTRLSQDVTAELSRLTGTPEEDIAVDTVGPSWGEQISEKARNALVVFLLAISIFITIRFEWKMAIATIVALFHDLLVVVGLYALFAFPVTPATVIALLTMLGFSIYDGIVVFDRVDENTHHVTGSKPRMTYSEMANLSLNQVLMRSLNTSITTLLPIASVLVIGAMILGASTLEEYGLALFLGLMSGAYSSLFIATPLLALLKEREPQYREVRESLAAKRQGNRASGNPVDKGDNPLAPGSAPRPRKGGGR